MGHDTDSYKGYFNQDDDREGVGIRIWDDYSKEIGYWLNDKLHGCEKIEYPDGSRYWGEYKDGKKEGYGT